MQLEKLNIRRKWGGTELEGDAEFKGKAGSIKVVLCDEHARRILTICADALIDVATVQAAELRTEVIDAQLAIPAENG